MSVQQIIEEVEKLSPAQLKEIAATIEQLERKRANPKSPESLFGAWADMDDDLFRELTDGTNRMRAEDDISQHAAT